MDRHTMNTAQALAARTVEVGQNTDLDPKGYLGAVRLLVTEAEYLLALLKDDLRQAYLKRGEAEEQ